ncbi:TPA: hypothetical protein N0F65_011135 [Lagenidium giganteum]|uniref:Integrase catalytic domain-containing protein n=1 Tax=Lagenidium giganteum TaxID=4803 RepID=A0AAV2ZI49_9STRA|nr:TPA: hypothetical protein N0F65_011135 [Lagenidium giganteum]
MERLQGWLLTNGVAKEFTEADTPHQNSLAERKHQTILDMARTMMMEANLPKFLWEEAMTYAQHIRNRVPTIARPDGFTPYEGRFKSKPDISHLRIFGEECGVVVTKRRGKLSPKATLVRFVGIDELPKGYVLYDPTSKSIQHSNDVRFVDDLKRTNNRMQNERTTPPKPRLATRSRE